MAHPEVGCLETGGLRKRVSELTALLSDIDDELQRASVSATEENCPDVPWLPVGLCVRITRALSVAPAVPAPDRDTAYLRPETHGQRKTALEGGVTCEVVGYVAEMSAVLLRGGQNCRAKFTVRPSENKGWAVFGPAIETSKDTNQESS